ncbi:hypothetical protein GGTG_08638 [Gaeumannomyces tritici R3-111a-1]|uniref:Uncharacterized protein n=1 Tax=Gaeumannomyces tritici (strain R3-111a-1) TaxID=644352 RepID=J3P552_GAET3|nr:hypothetical protein GGTG_08638 [Gaeumannomyces tritici R3-111a-1]EJT74800.1 hypothetical protein GGTG_08638 [Gaeumannomyces tritici R3-111a-1]
MVYITRILALTALLTVASANQAAQGKANNNNNKATGGKGAARGGAAGAGGAGAGGGAVGANQVQGIILVSAKGDSGTSGPLQLLNTDPKDAQIISDAEISGSVVNQCGRTLLNGNIDIGQNTEDAITKNAVTKVTAGGKVEATFKVTGGANPQIKCDMDLTSNGNGATGQTPLTVKQANAANNQVKVTIDLPTNMTLIGGSTGDIGTIRCRNAQNFGSCFPIQQTDTTPNVNDPDTITTANTLQGVMNSVAANAKAFKDVAAASAAAKDESEQGRAVINAMLKVNPDLVQKQNQAVAANAVGAKKNNGAGAGAGAKKSNGNGAKKNNAKQNRRSLEKRQEMLDRRATALVALKWAREVLSEEIDQ